MEQGVIVVNVCILAQNLKTTVQIYSGIMQIRPLARLFARNSDVHAENLILNSMR